MLVEVRLTSASGKLMLVEVRLTLAGAYMMPWRSDWRQLGVYCHQLGPTDVG